MSFLGRKNRVKPIPRNIDTLHDHTDALHICWMKLHPMCIVKRKLSLKDHRRFHLRFYIPRAKNIEIQPRIKRVVIILNGLDEVDYYTLYDQLGAGLAIHDIASILLPMPDHLNRHQKFRKPEKDMTPQETEERPSKALISNPLTIFHRYEQLIGEIDTLVRHIRGVSCREVNRSCRFFSEYFDPNARISILGYSLGGLAALAAFLKDPQQYTTCILLGSGVQLGDIEIERVMDPKTWKKFIDDLHKRWNTFYSSKKFRSTKDRMITSYFGDIFLGNNPKTLSLKLKEHTRRVLFILGGADPMVRLEDLRKITPKDHGFALLGLPGVSHFLAIDEAWVGWSKVITDFIAGFEENATHEFLPEKEIRQKLATYHIEYKIFSEKNKRPMLNKIFNNTKKYDFMRLYRTLVGYVGTEEQAIEDILKEVKKMKNERKSRSKLK